MLAQIQQLSVAERVQFVEYIWDTIASQPEALVVTNAQRDELQRRLEAIESTPEEGFTWPELKARMRNR